MCVFVCVNAQFAKFDDISGLASFLEFAAAVMLNPDVAFTVFTVNNMCCQLAIEKDFQLATTAFNAIFIPSTFLI